jgi:hypothetical protein
LAELYSVLNNSVAARRSVQPKHFRAFEPRQIRLSFGKGEGKVRVESFGLPDAEKTPHLNPLPFTKGTGGDPVALFAAMVLVKNFSE